MGFIGSLGKLSLIHVYQVTKSTLYERYKLIRNYFFNIAEQMMPVQDSVLVCI